MEQFILQVTQSVDHLTYVSENPDSASLIGHRPGDRLADPPGGVGGELITLGVVEFLHRVDQAQIVFLGQVQQWHAVPGVALGERDDQSEVDLQQMGLRPLAVADDPAQVPVQLRRESLGRIFGCAYSFGGIESGLDALAQIHLLFGGE